ncbi:hypothetical protein Pcinc_030800 [Petrolisthes cinctipes]|uniref:Reverse transcriptase domain-containing protein n=1 Tax=Petrolisthes cinctipes TaxID=88211 RepID=A0AAE1EXD8_PETCI|nr:hypothetical protein Pcinc_030800 [Petrolisthes cinctipes]
MFADDTKYYQILEDQDIGLQEDIETNQSWANKMQMIFHPEKCKAVHLGSKNPHRSYMMASANHGQHQLAVEDMEKDLGITIDNKLQFSQHIQAQVNKANKILGAINKTLNKTSFLHLYKSLIRPHLEYASVIWSPNLKRDKDDWEQIQLRATGLVEGISHLSYSERLVNLGLPTLQFRRKRADVVQTFMLLRGLDKVNYRRECSQCGRMMFKSTIFTTTRGHNQKYSTSQDQEGICYLLESPKLLVPPISITSNKGLGKE